MNNYWVTYIDESSHFKTHTLSSAIEGPFLAHLMAIGFKEKEYAKKTSINFETNGGFGSQFGWPTFSFKVGEKELVLNSNVVAETGKCLLENKSKKLITGQVYRELYHRMHILVLSEAEALELLPQLESKLVEAREASKDYMSRLSASWAKGAKEYKEKHGTSVPYEFVPIAKGNV